MRYTGNLNLLKPEGSDVYDIDHMNQNADIIDSLLFKVLSNQKNFQTIGSEDTDINFNKALNIDISERKVNIEYKDGNISKVNILSENKIIVSTELIYNSDNLLIRTIQKVEDKTITSNLRYDSFNRLLGVQRKVS